MTERAEIERLLNQTGRTLEGLPTEYSTAERIDCVAAINTEQGAYRRANIFADRILHQSDVIELLVGALRDTLEKVPKWISLAEQKPDAFVSVQVYMTDAGDFPPVREGYRIDDSRWFYIPALDEMHPVSHWKPFDEPPKGGTHATD